MSEQAKKIKIDEDSEILTTPFSDTEDDEFTYDDIDDNDTWDILDEELSNFVELLTFTLEHEQYGINVMEVSELIRPVGITYVPRAPIYIDGIVSVRGAVIPMINLKKILGLTACDKAINSRYIFVQSSRGVIGFIADTVLDVVQVQEALIEPPPAIKNVRSDLIGGVGRFNERMIIILDFANIMNILKDIDKIFNNEAVTTV